MEFETTDQVDEEDEKEESPKPRPTTLLDQLTIRTSSDKEGGKMEAALVRVIVTTDDSPLQLSNDFVSINSKTMQKGHGGFVNKEWILLTLKNVYIWYERDTLFVYTPTTVLMHWFALLFKIYLPR